MRLLASIIRWQKDALKIAPPSGTDRLPAVGGLPGPAFFPEGFGLSQSALRQDGSPTIIAVGHNFGCQGYRKEVQSAGREDDKATRRNLDALLTQKALDAMSAVHPIGRIGRPEEIADAVAWLFSDRSSYYTGQSLILDGGLTAQRPYVTQSASDKLLQNARDEKWRVGPADPSMTDDLNCR
jgi:hypothetical protein